MSVVTAFRGLTKRQTKTIRIGDRAIPLHPVKLERALEAGVLVAPYLAMLGTYLPDIQRGLEEGDTVLGAVLRSMLSKPDTSWSGDAVKLIAILLDVDPEWLAAQPARDILAAVPHIDGANDLSGLVRGLLVSREYSRWLRT